MYIYIYTLTYLNQIPFPISCHELAQKLSIVGNTKLHCLVNPWISQLAKHSITVSLSPSWSSPKGSSWWVLASGRATTASLGYPNWKPGNTMVSCGMYLVWSGQITIHQTKHNFVSISPPKPRIQVRWFDVLLIYSAEGFCWSSNCERNQCGTWTPEPLPSTQPDPWIWIPAACFQTPHAGLGCPQARNSQHESRTESWGPFLFFSLMAKLSCLSLHACHLNGVRIKILLF